MRRFFKTVSVFLLCGILSCQMVEGRGRNNGNNGASQQRPSTSQPSRPNNNSRPTGGQQGSQQAPSRPGGNQGSNRPNGAQPGGNHGKPDQRPSNPGNNFGPGHAGGNHNPGHGQPPHHDPGHGHGPNHGPGPGHHHGVNFGVPYRPYMPPPRPFHRPVPPAYFVPMGGPVISTILGIAIGTSINYALNSLVSRGYQVTGYGNNAIYVSNAYQLNLLWPNATMYYNNGMLQASEFVYSTPYYDTARYNMVYSMLINNYGLPISSNVNPGGALTSTWWGNNGQFISLTYSPSMAANGSQRFYTTLSFGI